MLCGWVRHVFISKLALDNDFVEVKVPENLVMHRVSLHVLLNKLDFVHLFLHDSEIIHLRFIFRPLGPIDACKNFISSRGL